MIAKLTKNDFDGIFELIEKAFPPTNTGKKAASARCFHCRNMKCGA